ncbi:membrane protein of er body-like protein [Quercus suber]|uniref:Membrane protein of er body-like protein n=1 Tax=Quercus suber TaxID=58331 RepID=A0AAW0KRP0_QUESU
MEMEREREGQLWEVEVKIEKEAETAEAEAEAEAEVEGGLVERWRFQRFSTTAASNGTGHGVFTEQSVGDEAILIERGTKEINVGVEDIISTPVVNPNPPASKDSVQELDANASTSINIETTEHGSELRATELYFEALYNKPGKHAFYCPNCKACIDKVLLQSTEDGLRCPSCFEFLKPIGDWIFRKLATSEPGIHEVPSNVAKPTDSRIQELPSNVAKPTESRIYDIPSDKAKPTNSRSYETPSNETKPTDTKISEIPSSPPATTPSQQVNIVALALANLITGVFLIGHHLQELKNDQSTVVLNETDEQVDRYQELLGQKRNFVLHASVAILSFLVFGLVPPVVYGFSFYQSDNRNLKLAVVAAASLLCITVLAIVKAYTQKPSKWSIYITTILYYLFIGIGASVVAAASLLCITVLAIVKAYTQKPSKWSIYITTILYYLFIGIGASGISYLAGYLVRKLIEKLGWFESSVATIQPMSFEKPAWESY